MSVWAIIPVKPLTRAKSRLQSVLSPDERQQLAEHMMRHVITTVKAVPQVHGVLVISRDTKALAMARELGTHTVVESGNPELNNALMRATQVVAGWGGRAVMVLPADIPLISVEDVTSLCELGETDNTVVISTDGDEDGTNALFIRPPGLIPYAYGMGSYRRHIALAEEAGATIRVYNSERLQLDIDVPADLEFYRRLVGNHAENYYG